MMNMMIMMLLSWFFETNMVIMMLMVMNDIFEINMMICGDEFISCIRGINYFMCINYELWSMNYELWKICVFVLNICLTFLRFPPAYTGFLSGKRFSAGLSFFFFPEYPRYSSPVNGIPLKLKDRNGNGKTNHAFQPFWTFLYLSISISFSLIYVVWEDNESLDLLATKPLKITRHLFRPLKNKQVAFLFLSFGLYSAL